jgi:ribosomal protein S19
MLYFYRDNINNFQRKKVFYMPFYLLKLTCKRRKRQRFFISNNINIFRKHVFILRPFLHYKFLIYVGGRTRKIFINYKRNLGLRFGEFFMTRRFGHGSVMHARKKKKSKK